MKTLFGVLMPIFGIILTGCAAPVQTVPQTLVVTKTIYQPFVWPEYLKTCDVDPAPLAIPHITATDPTAGAQAARYIVNLRAHDAAAQAAADDCRDTLAAALAADNLPPLLDAPAK